MNEDVIDDTSLIGWSAMLAQMLNAPIAKLSVSNEINVGNDFLNGRSLLFFNTVFKDVLDDKAAGFTESDFVPHASQSVVDLGHDLWWLSAPSEFE